MKTRILLALALFSLILAIPAARIYAASSNYGGGSTVDPPITVTFPSTTDSGQTTSLGGSGAQIYNFTLSSSTAVDIFVGDGYLTGDQYLVSLDGSPLFTTSSVPAGGIGGGDGCNGSADVANGLSWGDATVELAAGTHTINVTDVSTVLNVQPAGLCLVLSPPPSFGTPQFPLGLPLLLALTMVGLVVVRKSVLPKAKRTV